MLNRFRDYLKKNINLILYVAFSFIFVFGLTIGPKTDFDIWFHLRAGEYFFETGLAPTTPIDAWYAQTHNLYWVSHEWLFGVLVYWLMNMNPLFINLLSPLLLSLLAAMVAYYNRALFLKSPALAFIGIMVFALVIRIGNTPRPHLFAYLFTFVLFAILKKDNEEEGNTVYWLIPLTVLWTNMHGGSYILLFLFLLINIIIGCFEFNLGRIEFRKSSKNHQLKRIAVFVLGLALVSFNAHGLNMYYYPFSNFADNLMQGNISEWNAPDLKEAWQIFIYIMVTLYFTALMSTNKKIKALDLITGFAYMYLTFRSIRFAPQMAIIVMMIIGNYVDSLDFISAFTKKMTFLFGLSMFVITGIAVVPRVLEYPSVTLFNTDSFPSEDLLVSIKTLDAQRLYNPYDVGGYLAYKGLDVFVDGRADIYTTINLRDALRLQRGSSSYLELIRKYDFDYLLVPKESVLDTYLALSPGLFNLVLTDEQWHVYAVAAANEDK